MIRRAVPYVLAVVLIVIGFTQLNRYNVTWDEALGDFFFGQRYLSYFTSFDRRYLDFAADPYPPGFVPDLRSSEFRFRPWEYWPIANTLAAATSRVLAKGESIVDPFDGFHAFNLLIGAALLIVFYRWLERWTSTMVAVVATAVLFLMPRVVCDLMANIKDFPEMVFFSLALIAFFTAYERASTWGIVASGVVWGLALGTKANAWFAPLVILAFIAVRGLGPWREQRVRLVLALLGAVFLGVAILFATWPYLWPAPLTRMIYNFKYLTLRVGRVTVGSAINPWFAIATTTPPIVLILAAIGLPTVFRRGMRREPFAVFLIVWLLIVGARISVGKNFDGVRHFLEIFPPIAALAGIGTDWVATWAGHKRWVVATVSAIPIALTALATIASHPFETAYWNVFVGGLSGARARNIPQACDYWAASYRLGLEWIDANVPPRSVLLVPIAGHAVQLVAPLRLRPDITFVPYPRRPAAVGAERLRRTQFVAARVPVFVMFVPRHDWSTELDADCMLRLKPVHAWMLDRAPVLLIYRYTPP